MHINSGLTRCVSTGEKLRKRLDDLEMLASSVVQVRQTGTAQTVAASESARPATLTQLTLDALPATIPTGEQQVPSLSSSDQFFLPPTSQELDGIWADVPWAAQAVVSPRASPPAPAPSSTTPSSADESSVEDVSSQWDTAISIDPCYLLPKKYQAKDAEIRYTSLVDCGCAVRHVEMRRSGRPAAGHYDDDARLRWIVSIRDAAAAPTTMLPDLYANNIRVETLCLVSAMWANCQHMGLSQSTICEDEGMSPFYRPGASSSSSRTTLAITRAGDGDDDDDDDERDERDEHGTTAVRTVQRIFKTLKPDLRPIREQITTPHHPCVDVFPFPTLRRNLLRGLAAGAAAADVVVVAAVDEDDFYNDLLQGLVCWAGGAGLSRRDRDASTGRAPPPSGAPWDARSWEARPWFLRKYWALLGGDEGELVRQSRWWRGMRGEEEDVWSGEVLGGGW